VIVGKLIHVEGVPRSLIASLYVAGKYAVPEIDLVQPRVARVAAPDDTDVEHVEVVIRQPMHAAVVVVVTVRNNYPGDVVGVLGFHAILDVVEENVESFLARRRLCRLVGEFRHVVDVSRQLVSIPERHEQPDEAGDNKDAVELHWTTDK